MARPRAAYANSGARPDIFDYTWGFLRKPNLLLLLSSKGIDIFYLQGIMAETPKKHASPPQ
jgi:hypothetical protein